MKGAKTYPKLWTHIQELALKRRVACDGAVVGGGVKSSPPATGTPGTLWLLTWLWGRPTTAQTYELRSHCVVKLEELTDDWADTAVVGIYCTEEYPDSRPPKGAKGPGPQVDARAKSLPPIEEEKVDRGPSDPINAHERGAWCPEEPRPSPTDWVPTLESIPEGTEEDSDSFHPARSVAGNEELYADYMVRGQAGGSSSSSSRPDQVLWLSRGSETSSSRPEAVRARITALARLAKGQWEELVESWTR